MGKVSDFRCFVAFSVLMAAGAWAQTRQETPTEVSIGRGSAEPLTPAKQRTGALEVLSDTQGVDFGPYLKDVVRTVRENWYKLVPEEARPPVSKKGTLAIEFAVKKDGNIDGMRLVAASGDTALDRAAWAGITASNPLPSLPLDFKGNSLALRFRFYYNPDKADLAEAEPSPPVLPVIHAVGQTAPEKRPDNGGTSSDPALPTLCFPQPKTQTRVDAELINNQEASFAPYLEKSVLPVVRANWYRLASKSARNEGGQVTVEFSIQKDGSLGPAKVTDISGNPLLGPLALRGLDKSGPFPALPSEFSGQSVEVRSRFHYDPDIIARSPSALNSADRGAPAFLPICNPNGPTQAGDCLSPPRATYSPEPTFSPQASQEKFQGTVTLSVVVAADGSVQSACAMQSLAYGLDKEAVDAVRRWKFEPATLNGKPMPVQVIAQVDFHLHDKEGEQTLGGAAIALQSAGGDSGPRDGPGDSKGAGAGVVMSPTCTGRAAGCTSDAVYEPGDGVTAPKAAYTPDPQYVDKARKEKINGSVVLSMIVTAEGKVRDVKVIKSLDPGLDNQAVATVRTWRFEPGLKNGKAVAVRLKTEVMFRLY